MENKDMVHYFGYINGDDLELLKEHWPDKQATYEDIINSSREKVESVIAEQRSHYFKKIDKLKKDIDLFERFEMHCRNNPFYGVDEDDRLKLCETVNALVWVVLVKFFGLNKDTPLNKGLKKIQDENSKTIQKLHKSLLNYKLYEYEGILKKFQKIMENMSK